MSGLIPVDPGAPARRLELPRKLFALVSPARKSHSALRHCGKRRDDRRGLPMRPVRTAYRIGTWVGFPTVSPHYLGRPRAVRNSCWLPLKMLTSILVGKPVLARPCSENCHMFVIYPGTFQGTYLSWALVVESVNQI